MSVAKLLQAAKDSDAKLPLCLRRCHSCDLIIEVRYGKMDEHLAPHDTMLALKDTPCPGKRWRP